MDQQTDERLWRIAKKRANFRRSLTTYFVINGFLWAIWWFTSYRNGYTAGYWPVWSMLGWGLGIAFQYFDAYGHTDRETATQQEYERLKRQQGVS